MLQANFAGQRSKWGDQGKKVEAKSLIYYEHGCQMEDDRWENRKKKKS